MCFIIRAWIMLACMIKRTQNPSPQYRTKAFHHYLSISNNGTPPSPTNRIDERRRFTEFKQLIINQKNRLAVSREYKKQHMHCNQNLTNFRIMTTIIYDVETCANPITFLPQLLLCEKYCLTSFLVDILIIIVSQPVSLTNSLHIHL